MKEQQNRKILFSPEIEPVFFQDIINCHLGRVLLMMISMTRWTLAGPARFAERQGCLDASNGLVGLIIP